MNLAQAKQMSLLLTVFIMVAGIFYDLELVGMAIAFAMLSVVLLGLMMLGYLNGTHPKRLTSRYATYASRENDSEKSVFNESDVAREIAGLRIAHGSQNIIENGWFRRDEVMQGEDSIGFIQVVAHNGSMTVSVFAKAEAYCDSVRNIADFSMRREITTWNSSDMTIQLAPCYRT